MVDQDLELEQLDVKTTFLHGTIDEDIYIYIYIYIYIWSNLKDT